MVLFLFLNNLDEQSTTLSVYFVLTVKQTKACLMKRIIPKLLLGNLSKMGKPAFKPIQKRVLNIKAIWNNN
jgi:hypothetical protein